MNCKTARHQLALLVRNDLTQSETETVQTHLSHCFSCQQQFAELQISTTVLETFNSHALEAGPAPRSVLPRLQAQLAANSASIGKSSRWLSMRRQHLIPVAVGVALFFIGIQLPDYSAPTGNSTISGHAAPVGQRIDMIDLPHNFVPVYHEPSWQSLEELDRTHDGRIPIRNAGY